MWATTQPAHGVNTMPTQKKETLDQRWNREAARALTGRTIVAARYMTKEEAKASDWYQRPVVFILDNGTSVIVQRDDEGNDGGALYCIPADDEAATFILPVLY